MVHSGSKWVENIRGCFSWAGPVAKSDPMHRLVNKSSRVARVQVWLLLFANSVDLQRTCEDLGVDAGAEVNASCLSLSACGFALAGALCFASI